MILHCLPMIHLTPSKSLLMNMSQILPNPSLLGKLSHMSATFTIQLTPISADSKQWRSTPHPLPNTAIFIHGVLDNILPSGDMSVLIHTISLNIKPTPLPTIPSLSGQPFLSKKRKFHSVVNDESQLQLFDITNTSMQPSSSQITLAPSEDDSPLTLKTKRCSS